MEKTPENANVKKSEHLAGGEKPLIACVGNFIREDFDGKGIPFSENGENSVNEFIEKETAAKPYRYAFFSAPLSYFEDQGFLTGKKEEEYVITPLDSLPKLSDGYIMCTGLAGIGRESETGKNISFLSHQFPGDFLPGNESAEDFSRDISARLEELKKRSDPGSIDVVVVGGAYSADEEVYGYDYEDSIKHLSAKVQETFGFEPTVITGPKLRKEHLIGYMSEKVYLDTENRRLYISRPETGDASTESYNPSEINSKMREWRRESDIA